MSTEVRRCEVVSDRLLEIELGNGLEMHLEGNPDQYESVQSTFERDPTVIVI